MARINIEDSLWTDPRFKRLSRLLGSEFTAMGCVAFLFKLGQQYWKNEQGLIPKDIYELSDFPKELIEVGLVAEQENGFYVKGSEEHFAWLVQKVVSGRRGGLASASSRKNNNLTEAARSEGQAVLKRLEAAVKPPTPTPTPTPTLKKYIVGQSPPPPDLVQVVEHLNNKTGNNYQATSKNTSRLLKVLLQQGYRAEDIIRVINLKCSEWIDDPKMKPYLRPSTLFNLSKFEDYLGQAQNFKTDMQKLLEGGITITEDMYVQR